MFRLLLCATAILLVACSSSRKQDVDACTERGVAYFKEVEVYPYLSNGRKAEDVARERCRRTTGAFP